MIKQLWKKYGPNPLDSLLRRAQAHSQRRFLICWNRGLGDIPLGLYGLTKRIRDYLPQAEITFVTRSDLADGFQMLEGVSTIVDPEWKRGAAFDLTRTLAKAQITADAFDLILEKPDPTRWLIKQLGTLTPKLRWDPTWDKLCQTFSLNSKQPYVGVHVQTETQYAYEKNWPIAYWQDAFEKIEKQGVKIILFGFARVPEFAGQGIIDLRGKTSLFEMLSIIKNHCRYLLVPDSGVLSIAYYIDTTFPIDIVSLWADPRQGILKQNVASPNSQLSHVPLIAKNKDLRTVQVDEALRVLLAGVQR